MNFESKKGYSLVEIGVGVIILTIFLICSIALFNGCYNTYRMIQQRNMAINTAVSNMETLLQTDADILTGFFINELNTTTNEYELRASSELRTFVEDNFDTVFTARYARLNGGVEVSADDISDEEYEKYIYADKDYLINAYIADLLESYTDAEFTSEDVQNGNYAILVPNVIETGNQALLYPGTGAEASLIGEMAVRKTITRLPLTETTAYGNNVLKLKVEVLYSNKINTAEITSGDVKTITLESIKVVK